MKNDNNNNKICMQGMWPFQRSRKIFKKNFLCSATQNEAPHIMKLVLRMVFFLLHERIYGVNFTRIDNGPHAMTISRKFQKNMKIDVSNFCGHS